MLLFAAAVANPPSPRRVALLVGAKAAPPGLSPLRFAHADARLLADTLIGVGHFAVGDVRVMLDPDPNDLLRTLDDLLGSLSADRETELLFYYSGHADERSLFPNGKPLALADLRLRLDSAKAQVRIGLIDACRGGGWTRSKSFTPEAPFTVERPMTLASKGTVLIASSSGMENAHESEQLQGSFFTHHFAAGLLGAADANEDGEVSLAEVFRYARDLTVRDTARLATAAQHPSFEMSLHGRRDLVLSDLRRAGLVHVAQHQGPLEIIHIASGLTLLELEGGERRAHVALPAGKYLMRRRTDGYTYAAEIDVRSGQELRLDEAQLLVVGEAALAVKGLEPPPRLTESSPKQWDVELRGWAGADSGTAARPGFHYGFFRGGSYGFVPTGNYGQLAGFVGLTDRLTWAIGTGALSYRFGERGGLEILPWGGLMSVAFAAYESPAFSLGAGVDARYWLGDKQSLIFGVRTTSMFAPGAVQGYWEHPRDRQPITWNVLGSIGYSLTLRNRLTINLAAQLGGNWLDEGATPSSFARREITFGIGSVHNLGLRPMPLLQVQLVSWLAFDAYLGAVMLFPLIEPRPPLFSDSGQLVPANPFFHIAPVMGAGFSVIL